MKRNRACTYLFCLTLLLPASARADALAEIPSVQFRLSTQATALVRLGDIGATEIVANRNIALINGGRSLWQARANGNKLEERPVSGFANGAAWYGPMCAMRDGFVIAVQHYPEAQRVKEDGTPRGGFRAGPAPRGFVILRPTSPDRYLGALRVTSRPLHSAEDTGSNLYSEHVQSCAWDGRAMVLGSYGSLGKADFDAGSIELIDEDEELSFSRFPLLVEARAIWVGTDEGGMGGAALEMRPAAGKPRQFRIDAGEDVVTFSALARHQGRLVVGTSHGLFALDEQSGRFWRFDFGAALAYAPVTGLLSHNGFLWVFIGDQWLRVDVINRQALRYVDSVAAPLTTGTPFDGGWILSGPAGVWKYRAGDRARSAPTLRTRP